MTREQHSEDVAWLGQQYPEQAGAGTGALASEAPERDVAYRRYDPDRFNPVSGTCNPVAAMYDDLLGRSQLAVGFTGSSTLTYPAPHAAAPRSRRGRQGGPRLRAQAAAFPGGSRQGPASRPGQGELPVSEGVRHESAKWVLTFSSQ